MYQEAIVHPFSFAYFMEKNITYVTDWFSDSVYLMDGAYNNEDVKLFYKNSKKFKNVGQVRISGGNKIEGEI